MNRIVLTIPGTPEEISNLIKTVNVFLEPRGLPPEIVTAVDLVVEETLANAVEHGCDDGRRLEATVRIEAKEDEIAIRVEDDGDEFNPLTVPRKEESETSPDTEQGFGIHLIRNKMNAMTYSREDGRNVLEIWIYLKTKPETAAP